MQIREAFNWARTQIDPADARILLYTVLDVPAVWLIAHDDEMLTEEQLKLFQAWVELAATGLPIPYILGKCWFFGREFKVFPAVLIPRPETEELVQLGIDFLYGKHSQRVIDVGTGSGVIAVTLTLETADTEHQIMASDISADAVVIARQNAIRLGANVTFQLDDLLANQAGPFDLIIANLPYIAESERSVMGASVLKHEPHLALFSDDDGFSHIQRLLEQAQTRLAQNGAILLEIGYAQGDRGLTLCQQAFPAARCELIQDLAGHDRILRVLC